MSTCMHGSTGGCTIGTLLTVTGSWNNIHSSNTVITPLPFIGSLILVLHSHLMIMWQVIFLITWILQIFITHQVRKASTHSKSAMDTRHFKINSTYFLGIGQDSFCSHPVAHEACGASFHMSWALEHCHFPQSWIQHCTVAKQLAGKCSNNTSNES